MNRTSKFFLLIVFLLSFLISLLVPCAAAVDPTDGDQIIIPDGYYRLNDILSGIGDDLVHNIDFHIDVIVDGFSSILTVDCSGIVQSSSSGFNIDYIADLSGLGLSSEEPVNVYNSLFMPAWLVSTYGYGVKLIRITGDQSVDRVIGEWILNNSTYLPSDPSGDYILSGHYVAREGFSLSENILPVYSSIFFRSYDQLDSTMYNYEGMYIGVVNDSLIISYLPELGLIEEEYTVFVDGWQLDSYQSIYVESDVLVNYGFYYVFLEIFEPASEYESGFSNGYSVGYDDGFDSGYNTGYNQGFFEGSSSASGSTWFGDIIGDCLSALDRFVIFNGFSLLDLYSTVLGIFAVTWFLKLLAGG